MKIAVNTRLLLKNKLEGIGWFTYEIFSRMVRSHPEHQFYFLFDRPYDQRFIFSENVIPVVVSPPARHPVLHYWWFEHALPKALKKINPDLFISPDAYNSLSSPYRNIMVIHDLNFVHHPEMMPWLPRKYYNYYTPLYAWKASRIVTVSGFTKNDIVDQYKIPANRIDVVYNGANTLYQPILPEVQEFTKRKFTNGHAYFLFVGALNPRKNIAGLFQAFDLFAEETQSETRLVVVGEKMFGGREIKKAFSAMKHREKVIFTGRLEPEILKNIMGSALALTLVSFFEGFGIPVIEAFNAGIPVITSNTSALPEITGEAALLVNPFDTKEIADAMKKITFVPDLRKKLVRKGFQRSRLFSWDKAAEQFWEAVEKTVR
ncbi:glycosyltransferase family 4 protein [Candidatus Sulfidibacterium hydrothermale]|uniref:glycosyltransferase family 4 protein n=1 Tax=Candidatus Sulfidibacterium hydrothermale TaxID=2875962 RepID=UPI0021D42D07|nr:glycosyltransferase family 1 protein [Candidatus Sulfidibacterium hydrothermale]UBM61584.1 glycosyltransferase family 4 protein [Candidatus Sulfidibacterium hydrothermale]